MRICSDDGLWVGIVIFHNGALQFGDIGEGAAADAVSGDLGEQALDHVGPDADAE